MREPPAQPKADEDTRMGAVALAECVIDQLFLRDLAYPAPIMVLDIPELRRAVEKASREDLVGLVGSSVRQAVATAVELLARSRLALRATCREHDQDVSLAGDRFPPIVAEAEHVERAARFVVEIISDYAKVVKVAVDAGLGPSAASVSPGRPDAAGPVAEKARVATKPKTAKKTASKKKTAKRRRKRP